MSLPTTRRIVTGEIPDRQDHLILLHNTSMYQISLTYINLGHNAQGRSIIESDQVLTPANPVDPEGKPPTGIIPGFTNLFRTDGVPAKVQGPWSEVHGKKIGLVAPDGVYSRIVDFPPTGDADDKVNIMHRTQSVDFGVVLKGSIQLVLEDGVETTVGEGEVVVQRGTNHVSLLFQQPARLVCQPPEVESFSCVQQRPRLTHFSAPST